MNSERTTRKTGQKTGLEVDQPVSQKSGETAATPDDTAAENDASTAAQPEREIGGRKGPDPTRFGDWEKGGRCIDF